MWHEAVECVLNRVDVRVVAKSTSSSGALAQIGKHQPQLFVTDVDRADGHGLGTIRLAHQRAPHLRVVVLAAETDPHEINQVLGAGAVAYVLKSAHPEDLASAVRQAFEHSVYFAVSSGGTPTVEQSTSIEIELTKREREILRLVAEGHSNAQLAAMLWVTEQTVKFHLSNVYRKLNVANRTEAARWAQLHGILPIPDSSKRSLTAA
jgi:DNA-binding NarL/FixJ family response regulator